MEFYGIMKKDQSVDLMGEGSWVAISVGTKVQVDVSTYLRDTYFIKTCEHAAFYERKGFDSLEKLLDNVKIINLPKFKKYLKKLAQDEILHKKEFKKNQIVTDALSMWLQESRSLDEVKKMKCLIEQGVK